MRRVFLVGALLLALAAVVAPGTASAQFVPRVEIEPNDSTTMPDSGGPVLVDTAIRGSITPGSDIDFFQVTVLVQTRVAFATWIPDRPTCTAPSGFSNDTVIRLWDASGVQIAMDDQGGVGNCSLLIRDLAPGTYFISVEDWLRNSPILAYTLEIDFGAESFPPTSVTLSPASDVNLVGTPHTVTATVLDQFGNRLPAQLVHFVVSGGGTPTPPTGVNVTNTSGQATFTFTNTMPSDNTIQAFVPGCCSSNIVTKRWVVPGQPTSVTLSPSFATNPVGTLHTVTATVRSLGNPVPGQLVHFVVSGDGTPAPATGFNVTDVNGRATFTFTNTQVGTNTIQATVPGCCVSNLATKRWIAGPPARLTLSPAAEPNPVGSQHCVTATVTDVGGNPNQNVTVRFTVTGSVNTSGSATTNASGMATFCYNGPPLPGADAIHAYADTNRNNVQDALEPFGDATKTWVLPVSTPGCEVKITNGGWIIANNGDRATFGGNAKVDADGNVTGNEEYQDHGPAQPMNLHGDVLVVECTSTTEATIYGEATVDGGDSFFYRIKVRDLGEPGKDMDRYELLVGNGYYSGDKTFQGGNAQIHTS